MENRDDDIPDDILNIRKLAAIRDSYSPGIGAEDRLGSIYDDFEAGNDFACARYDHAYPYLVNQDSLIGDPSGHNFQFFSWSGAVMKDVLDKQIPKLDNNQDAINLCIGGNDVGLRSLLNSCIFQMGVFIKQQAEVAKLIAEMDKDYAWAKDFDWDSRQKEACHRIYVTGYAKFFAEDMTMECDKVTWTTWIYKLANLGQPADYLTRARHSVRSIHFDPFVGKYGGRYCEPGVDEATSERNTRKGLMFYELNSWGPAGTSPWKRETDGGELSGTFYGDMLILAQITRLLGPDAELHHDNGNNRLVSKRELAARADIFDYLVPNGYAHVFHPQIALHEMIASLVVYEIMVDHQVRTGYAVWTPPRDNKDCEP
ncbi:hypothetical protein LCI18_003179 [Fusarium solani-melongenae]|uniref:Uncharacterized protein n=1 Tax=Fusarium solani subsp. cucurbitae TaxID=2747967 RepID=A0ACD3YTG3_FUSSC|nr:hypothetical protein LCI18_003179 [Fusarium solani-melongenae]